MTFKLFNLPAKLLQNPLNRQLLMHATKEFPYEKYMAIITKELLTLQTGCWGYGGGLFHIGADSKEAYHFTSSLDPSASKQFCRLCACNIEDAKDLQFDVDKAARYTVNPIT